jgi:hypothetical protein
MEKFVLPILLSAYGFVVCGIPLSRFMLGPMPVYFIDVAAFLILLFGARHMGVMYRRHSKISSTILVLILALVPTTGLEYLRMGFMEPTYLLARTILHILTVWSLSGLLRDRLYLQQFLIGLAAGVLFTSAIASLNSLPITGSWIRAHVFTISWLKPPLESALESPELIMILDKEEAERGNSLLGKSNITGCVIITLLPFLIGSVRNMRFSAVTRLFFQVAIAAGFFALIFTYSRSNYLGFALLIFCYLLFERQSFSRRLLPVIIVAASVIGFVGMQSTFFKFDFVAEKFDLSNKTYAGNNEARILSYTRPVELLINDPTYFLRGAGRADMKLRSDDPDAKILILPDAEMHSVFAASVFYRGFIAMVATFWMYFLLAKLSYRAMNHAKQQHNPDGWMATASLISLVSLSPPWAFTHYLVTKMTGHMHLFIVVTLVVTSLDYLLKDSKQPITVRSEAGTNNVKRILSRASRA